MKCRLCDQDLASVFQTRILSSEREINALRFLKNDPACFGPKSGPYSLCIGCSKRIKMVVAMQQEFDTSSKANVKTDEETEKKNYDDDEDVEEEDIELETRVEEDILIDSDSNDPEYAPPFKKAKKHQAAAVAAAPSRKRLTPRRSSVAAAAALHLDDEITTDSACRQIVSSDDGNKKSGDGGNDYVVCQLCNARIRRVASLRRHYITQHQYDPTMAVIREEESNLGNEENSEAIAGVNEIFEHQMEDEPEEPDLVELQCQVCNLGFKNKHVLIKHALDEHTGDVQPVFACNNCDKTYRYEKDLAVHLERLCAAVNPPQQKCDVCGKSYSASHIFSHRTYAHVCRFCPDLLPTRTEKVGHLREKHFNEMVDTCGQCGMKFETAKCLRRHKKYVHDVTMIKCPRPDCKFQFPKSSPKLKTHLRVYHNPEAEALRANYRHECPECGSKFKNAYLLQCHHRDKHDPKEPRAVCPFCSFSVPKKRRKEILRSHIPVNHPDKKDYTSSYQEDLKKRQADLERRARVSCYLCPFAATRQANMSRHYEDVHGYDKSLAESSAPDSAYPDGCLCPACGECFHNNHAQMQHLLKVHSKSTGEQCVYCKHRYHNLEEHINISHIEQKSSESQLCKRCLPEQSFPSFEELLRHARSYHTKKPRPDEQFGLPSLTSTSKSRSSSNNPSNASGNSQKSGPNQRLCENCGKTVALSTMARHKIECRTKRNNLSAPPATGAAWEEEDGFGEEMEEGDGGGNSLGMANGRRSKKYIPEKLTGICPYCEYKFADLLGHVRHNHSQEKEDREQATTCSLCQENFNSTRELITHRQKHPQFKHHSCTKCNLAEFDTVVELRHHRKEDCIKKKKKKAVTKAPASQNTAGPSGGGGIFDPSQQTGERTSTANTNPSSSLSVNLSDDPTSDTVVDLLMGLNTAAAASSALNATAGRSNTHPGGGGAGFLSGGILGSSTSPAKPVEYEGRGTVTCHLCPRNFTLKKLLSRHYVSSHGYVLPDKSKGDSGVNPSNSLASAVGSIPCVGSDKKKDLTCNKCDKVFSDMNARIRHQLDFHAILSGQICPYCNSKWGVKKFDNLDEHVKKHHVFDMQSPLQTCSNCKMNFGTYDELKKHRQIHEGGNKRLVEVQSNHSGIGADGNPESAQGVGSSTTINVHARLSANPEINNRGGVKCQLCNVFKLRKELLKQHYIKQHFYVPVTKKPSKAKKASATSSTVVIPPDESTSNSTIDLGDFYPCNICSESFVSNNLLIHHFLKAHCVYSGLICPYCPGHQPERFLDLQAHVTLRHMDKLTGYHLSNDCKVCKEKFPCYADLRDHVQTHGDAFRDPYGNPEAYKEYARKRKKINGKMVPISVAEQMELERDAAKKSREQAEQQQQQQNSVVSFHSSTPAAIPSTEDAAAILLNIKHESIMFTPQQLQLATPPQQLQLPTVQPPQQMQLPVTQPSQNLQLSHQQQRQVHYVHPPKVDHHIGQLQMQPNQLQVQSNQLQVQPNQLQVQPNQLQVQPNQLQELQNAPLQEQPPPNLGHQHLFVQDKHETLEAGVEEEEEANDADMTDASLNSTFLEQIINANFEKDKEGSVMIFDEEAANKLFEEEDERNRHH